MDIFRYEPKSCPFCGYGTIVDAPFWSSKKHACQCNSCGSRGKICRTWDEAVMWWNKRIKNIKKEVNQNVI